MRVLGAILAGGQSRRFGSDKAEARIDGRKLLDQVADALRPQVNHLVVAGRDWPGLETVPDLPKPGLGPLGGLAGALDHAWRHDHDVVLSSGCDIIGLPANIVRQMGVGPTVVVDLPIIGMWPVAMRQPLLSWLEDSQNGSVYAFADHIGARRIILDANLRNINRPEDLA